MKTIRLSPGFTLVDLEPATFGTLLRGRRAEMFPHGLEFDAEAALSAQERQKKRDLVQDVPPMYSMRWAIRHNRRYIGWTYGFQENAERFYMCNTAIAEEHRGKGLYTALLPHVLRDLGERGFQIVYSRHTATNNAVIVPKLKAGFHITGMELSDRHGTMVVLSYFFNDLRRQALRFRSGEVRPGPILAALLQS